MRKKIYNIDYALLMAVFALLALSLAFIYTASSTKALEQYGDDAFFLKRQMLRILLGAMILYLTMRLDYRKLLQFGPVMFWAALTLLFLLQLGPDSWAIRGTRRWISIGGFVFQPSELAKFGLILMLARLLTMKDADLRSFTDGLLPNLVLIGLACFAIIVGPDTGTSTMVFAIAMAMMFIAGARLLHLIAISAAGLTVVAAAMMIFPYQRRRLMNFIESFQDGSHIGWQVKQSLISLGNGGFAGIGLGESKQKLHWLPDPFTDFIFSIVGEELGLIGTLSVVALFLVILFRGFRIALASQEADARLLASGMTVSIVLYAFMNIAVITHLMPTTGIPMPFVSYGGSSLLMNMFAVGVLLNIHQQNTLNRSRVRRKVTMRNRSKTYAFGL